MKHALLDFYLRTAYNKDAIEYLQKFNSVEPERFALIIPERKVWLRKKPVFLQELAYLLKLGLSPTLFLPPAFFRKTEIREITAACARLSKEAEGACVFVSQHSASGELLEGLKAAGDFFKYILVLDTPFEDAQGRRPSRVFLRRGGLEWGGPAAEIMDWLDPFLRSLGPSHAVQIVRPEELLPELFTVSGCGTMISVGYDFRWTGSSGVDRTLLARLIEQGFGRPLSPDYFPSLGQDWKAMVEKDYIASIVVMPMAGMNYMDKFVVAPQYLGRGVGSLLLEELLMKLEELAGERPTLIWRARHDNPYLARYSSLLHRFAKKRPLSCGTVSDEIFVYHFLGVERAMQKKAVDLMRSRPGSFLD